MNHIPEREQFGRSWFRGAIQGQDLEELRDICNIGTKPSARLSPQGGLFKRLGAHRFLSDLRGYWPDLIPTRLLCFDKSESTTWSLPWHQDRIIAVQDRVDLPGFTNWSRKGAVWHCEPPAELLRQMLFLRIHLDENTLENGAMEIAPGSHKLGPVPSQDVPELMADRKTEICLSAPGDILVLSMLTLHRSRPASVPSRRRVLRLDLGPPALPEPLRWCIEHPQ